MNSPLDLLGHCALLAVCWGGMQDAFTWKGSTVTRTTGGREEIGAVRPAVMHAAQVVLAAARPLHLRLRGQQPGLCWAR